MARQRLYSDMSAKSISAFLTEFCLLSYIGVLQYSTDFRYDEYKRNNDLIAPLGYQENSHNKFWC